MNSTIPKIRFPKFKDAWKQQRLEKFFFASREKGRDGLPTLAVTMSRGLIDREDIERKTETNLSADEHLLVREGDIAYNMMRMWQGAFGRSTSTGIVSPAYVVVRPLESADSGYFEYAFRRPRAIHLFWAYSYGLTNDRLRLYANDFLQIPFSAPSVPEQKCISKFFAAVDRRIQLLNQEKKLLENFKNGVIQQLFSQALRFKDDQGNDFPSWKRRALGEVLEEHGSRSDGNEQVFSVSVHKGLVNQVEHLGRSYAAASTAHYNLVKPGDIVYTKSPTGDFPFGIVKQSLVRENVLVSPLYGVFTPETPALGRLLDAYFARPCNAHNYLYSIIQKGAKNTISITNSTFLSKSLLLPVSKKEQLKIGQFLSAIDRKLESVTTLIKHTLVFKKGLMQQMFT